MTPGLLAALALLPSTLLATACDGGRGPTARSGSGASAPTGVSVTVPAGAASGASSSADRALAAAINLTSSDLPGWTSTPNTTTAADRAMQARLVECAGGPDPAAIQVVDLGSPTFRTGAGNAGSVVTSNVTTVRSAADGRRDLAAMQNDKLPACIEQVTVPYLRSRLPAGATISQVSVERLGPPAGVSDSFSYRLVVPVSAAGQGTVTIISDTTGFLVGRVEVELNDTRTGGVPDPGVEHELVALLYQRARHAAR